MEKILDFLSYLFIGKIIRSNFFTAIIQNEEQSVNNYVEEYLDYYCNLEYAPEFAVLLKGDWGSGKTHFIMQYMKKLKRKQQRFLYVSLHGMTSFSDIEFSFFQQLHPIFASKKALLAGNLIGSFVKTTFKIDLNSDGKDDGSLTLQGSNTNLIKFLADVGQNILIFDDLERCQISLENILGYINKFVEYQELKVIIIADESKIENQEKYQDIKEKLIGKTLDINLDFRGAYHNFLLIVNESDAKDFLFDNIGLIHDKYEDKQYQNLRTLRQIVLDFKRIYSDLPEKVRKKDELLQKLLKLLVDYSIAIKCGDIQKSISELREKRVREINESALSSKEKIFSLDSLRVKHLFMNPPMIFPSESWWQTFFDKGVSDTKELKESIQNSGYFQDEKTPDCIKLRRFQELSSDEEFERLLREVESKYMNREYTEIGEIRHIFGLLLLFSDAGLYSKSKAEILEYSKLYVDHLRQALPVKIIDSYNTEQTYKGLDYFGTNFEEFKELSSHISKARELAFRVNASKMRHEKV